ncbi:MAG: oligosaccharide repeat unit polymerase [Bacteriovorax sp.]|nr:oligosaccharide repeat unit polymerase [Bacteriovorax sp.]
MRKLLSTPLTITIVWWIGWAIISKCSFTGLDIPTDKTFFIVFLFALSLAIGGLLTKLLPVQENFEPKSNQQMEKRFNFLFNAFSVVLFVILGTLAIKCSLLLFSHSGADYKRLAFSTEDYTGFLFNSKKLENLYFFISSPLLYYVGIYGLVDFWKNTNFKKLAIAFALNGLDGYIRLARVNVYMLIIMFLLVLLMSNSYTFTILKKKKKQLAIFLLSFLSILVIGSFRGYKANEQFNRFIIDYHTIGFSLFDYELKNPNSPLNQTTTYGRLSIGGLETFFTIFIRQFDKSYYSPALSNSIRMSKDQIHIGHDSYNSFYTLLYTFYSDGGFFGVILAGVLIGLYMHSKFKRWEKFHHTVDAFYVVLVLSTLILSIFVSQFEIMRTWIVLIICLLVDISTKYFKTLPFNKS